ncbi:MULTISPECIES: hypothetical protein [Acidithrix]|uniref:Uncharacterized protein n=1 Tax=Acidithrix ferrooxidans TaxID=1280514 RepID=A0A0D8HIE9_9ACTN|nr:MULTISPECIES: hypothetical protein [Acidithrix]KJF17765.1 hypothetical protein AXFE_13810 [Acidithrix ferrooxidans]CAG4922280.1 unnamed protein product [Acidithrix sp. C25]
MRNRRSKFLVRRILLGTAILLVVIASGLYAIGKSNQTATQKALTSTIVPRTTTTTAVPATTTTVDPGTLPQTSVFPSTNSRQFITKIADLWNAITTGNPTLALPSFFPESAYVSLKTITNPASDYQTRLLGAFKLDILAAHSYLGANASTAQFIGIAVPSWSANWVTPGNCYSNTGYWHVGDSRLLYRVGNSTYSIGIASLISWRGQWYVVHMGSVASTGASGIVNNPAPGVGVFGYAGVC